MFVKFSNDKIVKIGSKSMKPIIEVDRSINYINIHNIKNNNRK